MVVEDVDLLGSITKFYIRKSQIVFNTTPSRVERAIRHAIEVAWTRNNVEIIKKFFGTPSIQKKVSPPIPNLSP